jgi:tetratricopeptide (TPR) repeat protein
MQTLDLSRSRQMLFTLLLLSPSLLGAQEEHRHSAPEKLGRVSFSTSCAPEIQEQFERGVALLHSFVYATAEKAFRNVAERDPRCAMAHWGVAMTYFHQLWDPSVSPSTIPIALREIQVAQQTGAKTEREREFIDALSLIYQDADSVAYRVRAANYERAMKDLASKNPKDTEVQVFYALALLANESPTDKTHGKQKAAADLLEPLARAFPEHPGIPHYLIHAYDNAELASRGLPAAREYSKIASSAPHALHMPSHIFTRLGLWEDSIASNKAARDAAHRQGDTAEELHAMDYLVYAYLQLGRDSDAAQIVEQLKGMSRLNIADSKSSYPTTAIPVRYVVERKQWAEAASTVPPTGAAPYVTAIAVWARGVGLSRSGRSGDARLEADRLRQIGTQLRATGNDYWATQVDVMLREVLAWSAQADGKAEEAVAMMREAADEEDGTEKLPVTPGPIVPAREQLADLFLEQNHPGQASREFAASLANSPGRRGALQGAARAAELSSHK